MKFWIWTKSFRGNLDWIQTCRKGRTGFYLRYLFLPLLFWVLNPFFYHCKVVPETRLPKAGDLFWSYIPPEEGEKSTLTAEHYIISNETRIDLFESYLIDLGGGYIGVGTDQNLTFVGWMKSEYVWLMDFDLYSVRVNKMHISILKRCPQYSCFRNSWKPVNKSQTWDWIQEDYGDEKDFTEYKQVFDYAFEPGHVPYRLRELDSMTKNFGFRSFHNSPEDYEHLRWLALNRRIRPLKGDLTKKGTLLHISRISRDMQIPIRGFYTSNAEDYFRFSDEYRENILSIPTDEKGYHIRTISVGTKRILGFPEGEKYPDYPFHYNLQKIQNMQEWMKSSHVKGILDLMGGRREMEKGFSILESLPSSGKEGSPGVQTSSSKQG